MKIKVKRLETIKQLISSKQIGSQADLLRELRKEGYFLTQATLSRDLKQLKVAISNTGFRSIRFSGNIGVIRTNPGYASSIAFNIDNSEIPEILGTIAGDDTIIIVISDGADHNAITEHITDVLRM